ncbi:MGDG synthase family glycosyltransferase [Amycolatopsis jiangsuensis]|uniref:UDP-N-acetylglucosamine:LPS N-acetylglucosamine transferase n=1 Tax=Amycolatopsis jiangsuensis TaxID=1181879 RepID=A0A840IP29_9PSEU|nr:WS/DGAT domain-containing protein [Amycolatopsis jiangsuensis]MBB4684211.1 UDP-N-acetylglucosamine:LPS N-acetylglucosamine transferase [Amycolatopsis jiangsuensis]
MERVLIVSADMGEGHNATGRALEGAVRQRWPEATVRWVDALDALGPGFGPLFRRIYVANVETTPWLYEFFYGAIWRMAWFAAASRRFTAAWCGRRLAGPVAEFAPDLVLSTYPMGTAALAWLRRRGRLAAPIGAWVSDFAPHPFWVYGAADLTMVMHDVAVAPALRCSPSAHVGVSAPPVRAEFRPGDRAGARQYLDLPPDAFVALVSCGSLGFGDVEGTVRELLAADPVVLPVVVCGRNEELAERLRALREPRVRVVGWTGEMARYTIASDVVVTNAGGATGLEALACGRPLLMHRPIAAHGRANAALMARAGLALVSDEDGELTTTVRSLLAEPERLKAMAEAAARHCDTATPLARALESLVADPRNPPPQRLRAEDALFLHVATPEVPQQVGAVLLFDPKPDGSPVTRADAEHLVSATPGLRARLLPGTALWRPKWQEDPARTAAGVLSHVEAAPGTDPDLAVTEAMDEFFSVAVTPEHPVRARLVTGLEGGQGALLVALHHAASDGIAVISALVGQTRGKVAVVPPPVRERGRFPRLPGKRPLRQAVTSRRRQAGELVRGVWSLAKAGAAPPVRWEKRIDGPRRHFARVHLAAPDVRAAARRIGVPTTDFVLALVAEALHRELGADAPDRMRVLIPMSIRDTGTFRQLGNHTGAASVDLPTGRMPLPDRVRRTRELLAAQVGRGAPRAGNAVVRVLGILPPWLHHRLARLVYRGTWFSVIASVLPGARSPVLLDGARVRTVYPVLSLAPGVPVAVGVMTWADRFTVCVTVPAGQAARGDRLAAGVTEAFGRL